jgi:DNA repair protein SbcC/Rad50
MHRAHRPARGGRGARHHLLKGVVDIGGISHRVPRDRGQPVSLVVGIGKALAGAGVCQGVASPIIGVAPEGRTVLGDRGKPVGKSLIDELQVGGAGDVAEAVTHAIIAERGGAPGARRRIEPVGQRIAERQRTFQEAQIAQAESAIAMTTANIERARNDWVAARTKALAVPGCPGGLPETLDVDLGGVDAMRLCVGEAQQAEAKAQDTLAEFRKNLTGIIAQREALRVHLGTKAAERDTVTTARAEEDRQLSLARQAAQNNRATAERHASAVNPLLLALKEGDKALDDPELLGRLENLVGRVTKSRQIQKSAKDLLAELDPKVSWQASKSEAAAQLADSAKQQADARQLALDALRQKRHPLLGGEPTSAHRTRFNESRIAALVERDDAFNVYTDASNKAVAAVTEHEAAAAELSAAEAAATAVEEELTQKKIELGILTEEIDVLFALGRDEVQALRNHLRRLDDSLIAARAALAQRRQDLSGLRQDLPETSADDLRLMIEAVDASIAKGQQRQGTIENLIAVDAENRQKLAELEAEIAKARAELDVWQAVNAAIGSRNGDRFARFAQSITLDVLADYANRHLADLNPRYRLHRAADLALQVEDIDMGGEPRATSSLSGGERFLVSLALALAPSRMGGRGGLAATLFIDEGFGSLDAASLDLAIDALEGLQSQGRQVGVISHVEAVKDRIPVRIMVDKQGGGKSAVRIAVEVNTTC